MSSMLHPIYWNKQDSGNKHRFDDIKSGWTFAIKNLPENKPIISVAVNWYIIVGVLIRFLTYTNF